MSDDRQAKEKAKILIVDDRPDNLRLLSQILSGQGYEVRKAINGSTALMGLKAFLPDLILLDIKMPGLDGYQVCQKLKSDSKTKQIPIIFLSASDEVMDKVKAFEVGGVDYITKPFQVPEVVARVETQIKIQRFNRMRESLSRAIVHDLKNPLAVITLTSSSLVRRQCLEGKNLEALQAINATAQRLDSLLNDLLIVAKMDADRLDLHKTEISIQDLLKTTLATFQIAARAKQIDLCGEMPKLERIVAVDINLFQRAIENLLSNGIKFSPPNSKLILRVSYLQKTNETNLDLPQVRIEVIDEGMGVDRELQQKIFEPYNTGKYISGVSQIGLGLSFCKMVVEAHQGKIFVRNNQPQGTIFTIDF